MIIEVVIPFVSGINSTTLSANNVKVLLVVIPFVSGINST